jgi:tetratricopeptide (TPR) repeat protein
MNRFVRRCIAALFVAALIIPLTFAHAQDALPPAEQPAELVAIPPDNVLLEGFQMIWQDFNRCAAAALTIQLSYFDWEGTYRDVINWLNPHEEDVSVRPDEMAAFVELQGLRGIERIGGTHDMLKRLIANGFPVLLEMVYYDGPDVMRDWMRHKRVIMGYDDELEVFYTIDSLLGPGPDGTGREIAYEGFDERWKPFNRNYFVLYRPEDEELLAAVLGDHWDETANAEYALELAMADLEERSTSFAYFNIGSSLTRLERYEEAVEAFDTARGIGLPMRMLWYEFEPFEAYLAVGRHAEVIDMARAVIGTSPGVEEMYYYVALAAVELGELDRAESNLRAALWRNPNFTRAGAALAELRGQAEGS